MLLSPTTALQRTFAVVKVIPTTRFAVRSIHGRARMILHLGSRPKTWQQRWKHGNGSEDSAFSSVSVILKSLSAGIIGVGVLLVTWPLVDNITAPVTVRAAMVSEPRNAVEGIVTRNDELEKLDAVLDGTSPGIWIMDGVGKTTLLRMEQGRRPCMYLNLRETGSVNDLVFQLVTHLYQPLGGLGNLVVSYTQLVQASVNLLGATDGDVFNSYQELFFSLYLTHLRRAVKGATCTGPIVPFEAAQGLSFLMTEKQQQRDGKRPLLVLDHADIALALGRASAEPGHMRLLDELFLLAGAVSQDTAAGQVVVVSSEQGRGALEARLGELGCRTRRMTLGGMSESDTRELVQALVAQGKGGLGARELELLQRRAVRECKGDPKLVQDLVARQLWGGGKRKGATVAVGIRADEARAGRKRGGAEGERHGGAVPGVAAPWSVGAVVALIAVGLARGSGL